MNHRTIDFAWGDDVWPLRVPVEIVVSSHSIVCNYLFFFFWYDPLAHVSLMVIEGSLDITFATESIDWRHNYKINAFALQRHSYRAYFQSSCAQSFTKIVHTA